MVVGDIKKGKGEFMDVDRLLFITTRSNCQCWTNTGYSDAYSPAGERPRTDASPTDSRSRMAGSRCMMQVVQKSKEVCYHQRSDTRYKIESNGKVLQNKRHSTPMKCDRLLRHVTEGKQKEIPQFIISIVQPVQDPFLFRRIGFWLAAECPGEARCMQAQSFAPIRLLSHRLEILGFPSPTRVVFYYAS